MRLRRIQIRAFRKLAGPILLDHLGDGLTVIGGENEDGKSTLLAALKAAFFEHHRGDSAIHQAMRPYAGGVPEVEVDFVLRGERWGLRKGFQRGGVELRGVAGTLRDDEAEDRLRALLGFERRLGRGEARPAHHGMQALFWVDQGTSFVGWEALTGGRDRFHDAIAGEVGVAGIGERAIRLEAAVRKACARYWSKGWRSTGALAEAEKTAAGHELEVAAARRRVEEVAEKAARLGRRRDERRRLREDDAAGRAARRAEAARAELGEIERLERLAEALGEKRKAVDLDLERWRRRAAERDELRARLEAAGQGEAEAATRLRAADEALAAAGVAAAGAEAVELAAAAERRRLHREQEALEREGKRRARSAELSRLATQLAAARAAAEVVTAARARLAANPVTPARLVSLERLHEAAREARVALEAVATTVELAPGPGRAASRDGVPVDPASPLRLTERTTLELDGFGSLTVVPGGEDVSTRRARCRAAEDELTRALHSLGAADLAAARSRGHAYRADEAQVRETEVRLNAILGATGHAGLEELAAAVALLRAALVAGHDGSPTPGTNEPGRSDGPDPNELGPPNTNEPAPSVGRDPNELDRPNTNEPAPSASGHLTALDDLTLEARQRELRLALDEAELALGRAVAATRAGARLHAEAAQVAALARRELERRREDREGLGRWLEELRAELTDADLADALAAAAAAHVEAEVGRVALAAKLARLEPDMVRVRLEGAERELLQLAADAKRLDDEILGLEGELRGAGDEGVGERLAELEGLLAAARRQLERTRREADAWRLLHDTLAEARAEVRLRLTKPVLDRVTPWLARLFPDARPVLDPETLAPVELARDGSVERLDHLSHGTREQIAVLVRLGLATLLGEHEGEAPCLILDDALVYADEGRFETMKDILQRAARELQIIILTCRPGDYRGLAADRFRLEGGQARRLVDPAAAE